MSPEEIAETEIKLKAWYEKDMALKRIEMEK